MKSGTEINRRTALGLGLGTALTAIAAGAAAKARHGSPPAAVQMARMRAWEVGDRTGELTLRLVE